MRTIVTMSETETEVIVWGASTDRPFVDVVLTEHGEQTDLRLQFGTDEELLAFGRAIDEARFAFEAAKTQNDERDRWAVTHVIHCGTCKTIHVLGDKCPADEVPACEMEVIR